MSCSYLNFVRLLSYLRTGGQWGRQTGRHVENTEIMNCANQLKNRSRFFFCCDYLTFTVLHRLGNMEVRIANRNNFSCYTNVLWYWILKNKLFLKELYWTFQNYTTAARSITMYRLRRVSFNDPTSLLFIRSRHQSAPLKPRLHGCFSSNV